MSKGADRNGTARTAARRARRRLRGESKTALVLGGGGFTGGVYEIGALRAIDLLAVNRTVNDFDVYVGTSAGSFVAGMVANGVTPEEMMRVLNSALPSQIPDPTLRNLLSPNYRAIAGSIALLPLRLVGLARQMAANLGEVSMMDLAMGIAEGMPSGLYNNKGLRRYMAEVLSEPGRTDDFRELECELLLTATDVDTTERLVLGKDEWSDVPISTAVAASTALPLIYEPVELRGRQLMDGGIASTTNVDVAVAAGAELILVVNPLVPYVNDFRRTIPTVFGSRVRRVSDMGLPAIGNQAFRLMAHARLKLAVESWQYRFPGVDIVLLEPEPDDELMFGTSVLDYSSRLKIARHGFESVTNALARDYDRFKGLADRHGIEISARRVEQVLDTVEEEESGEIPVWRRVLEQTTGALLRQSREREAAGSSN
jgi:NTE family protein